MVYLVFAGPVAIGVSRWWTHFRNYFASDQLAYAAIAANVRAHGLALTEPFTNTGHSYYPSAYYFLVGFVSRVFDVSVPTAWSLVGLSFIALAVFVVTFAAWQATRSIWAPFLGILPLTLGTLSTWTSSNWFTQLEHHALLWGPYGDMFALNSQFAGLALCIIGATGLTYCITHPIRKPLRSSGVAASCALIGLTANVHAYAFLLGVAVLTVATSIYGMLRFPSRRLIVATALMLVLLVAAGGQLAEATSHLAVFAVFLAAVAPASLPLVRRWPAAILSGVMGLAAAALPQLLIESAGVRRHDEFLEYRQNSSSLVPLGVGAVEGVLAALPILLIAGFILVVSLRLRAHLTTTIVLGSLCGTALMTVNNLWGFNQEPYRFWLAGLTLSAFLMVPQLAWALQHAVFQSIGLWTAARSVLAVAALVYLLALADVLLFWTVARTSGTLDLQDERLSALRQVTEPAVGLLGYGPCIDPTLLKVVSAKSVATFHPGISWPERKDEIDHVKELWNQGLYDPVALRAAGITHLVTDSGCAITWDVAGTSGALRISSENYTTEASAGTMTLWSLR